MTRDSVLIVDFGSQVTQLIARRVRENGVYSEIHPYNKIDAAFLAAFDPKAIILSGGPASVTGTDTPRATPAIHTAAQPSEATRAATAKPGQRRRRVTTSRPRSSNSR